MTLGHYTLPHIRKLTFQGLQYVKQKWKYDQRKSRWEMSSTCGSGINQYFLGIPLTERFRSS